MQILHSCTCSRVENHTQEINTGGREVTYIITTVLVIYCVGYHCVKATTLQLEPTWSECRLKSVVLHQVTADPSGFRGKRQTGHISDQGNDAWTAGEPQLISL